MLRPRVHELRNHGGLDDERSAMPEGGVHERATVTVPANATRPANAFICPMTMPRGGGRTDRRARWKRSGDGLSAVAARGRQDLTSRSL